MAVHAASSRITVEEYHRMADVGLLQPDARVELLEGKIQEMAPIGSRHAACVYRLTHILAERLSHEVIVAVQGPLRLSGNTEVQPDIALLKRRDDWYADSPASPADVEVVIEVCDTTATSDRRRKVPVYATSAISEMWLVDLNAQMVEIYRRPRDGRFLDVATAGADDYLVPDAFPDVSLAVAEFLF